MNKGNCYEANFKEMCLENAKHYGIEWVLVHAMREIIEGKIDEDIKLFRVYRTAQRFGAHYLLKILNGLLGEALKKAVITRNLPLIFYDFYKLMRLCSHPIKIGRRMP